MKHLSDIILFHTLLEQSREIVGIQFIFTKEVYDVIDEPTFNHMTPYCTMVRNATQNKSMKVTAENFACASAARALGLIPIDQGSISGSRHAQMNVYKNLTVSRNVAKNFTYCEHQIYGVVIKPLKDYVDSIPDIIIIITNPYNAMRIIQGNAYHLGQLTQIKMVGMQGICQECTSYPFESNNINISMLCSGTRHVAQWKDDELGIGMPFHFFESVVDGIQQTANEMETNERKKRIEEKAKKNNLTIILEYSKNYYTHAYKGCKKK